MCFSLDSVSMAGLTFAQLANVQTVGIGLYLALAVIQAISVTGVAGLTRRLNTLRAAVTNGKLGPIEIANVRSLSGQVSRLEIRFHHLNRRLLVVVFCFFCVSVVYFIYCTIQQNLHAGLNGLWFTLLFYLLLPILIFMGNIATVAVNCRAVAKQVAAAERRIRAALLNLPT